MLSASHHRSLIALIISISVGSLVTPVSATEFAVLRQRLTDSATIDVPSTGNPSAFRPLHLFFDFPDSDLDPNSDEQLAVDTDPVLDASTPAPPAQSYIFNVTLTDLATGQLSTKFSDPFTIGFDGNLPSSFTVADMCLGYLDPNSNTWKIQDAAASTNSNGAVQCSCNHLTTFFFGPTSLVPEPASMTCLIAVLGLMSGKRRRRA